MKKRNKILALLFTAICLLGILPFSVSAYTPAIEGISYRYISAQKMTGVTEEGSITQISGVLHDFTCSGSPLIEGTVAIDIFESEIIAIGNFTDGENNYVHMQCQTRGMAYIPEIETLPIYFNEITDIVITTSPQGETTLVVIYNSALNAEIPTYLSPNSKIIITLSDILETTDVHILNNTLKAFMGELTTENYTDWILGGYNDIVDVFIDNAKVQYVLDSPIFIIALVVLAFAIAFAIATYIYKSFRRY